MINAVGRDIPEEILEMTGKEVFQGNHYRDGYVYKKDGPYTKCVVNNTQSKLVANIHDVLIKCGIKDGMTLGFHHHFRDGDYIVNMVMEEVHKMGIKDITICASSLGKAHDPIVPYIEDGTITADQAKMGYVGAYTYAEVISGYTSFYLGAKSVCPSVTMDVTFTGSWYDETAEKEGANNLIAGGCVLISQHADSMGAPTACEVAGVPNVSYNGSTIDACPNTFIVSSRIDWAPYFEYMINCVVNGDQIAADWTGTLATGSVVLSDVNEAAAAAGTVEAIEAAKAELEAGTLHVFDVSTFTVGGESITSYMADVDTDPDYTPDTEAIVDGYFAESTARSAPYFDIQIDGITLLDSAF